MVRSKLAGLTLSAGPVSRFNYGRVLRFMGLCRLAEIALQRSPSVPRCGFFTVALVLRPVSP